jgi:formate dehydrogenase major subunit
MSLIQELDYGTPAVTAEKSVTLSIDGHDVTVREGTSIMRAAMEAGIKVPKLCATDSLNSFGSCRLCLVEIEGRPGTPASCTTLAAPGMKVHTASDKVRRLRRGVMELYISDHPLDCLTCSANGNCELQDAAGEVGLRDVRYGYDGANHLKAPIDASNPYFQFEPSKCIVCSRCVRACEEVQGTFALTVQARGFASKIAAGMDEAFLASECVSCGACVQACPTATLMEKSVVDLGQPEHSVVTTCAYCGVGCNFKAEMRGDTVVRMVPWKDGQANHGHSCVKGRFAWGYAQHQDRILKPMIREKITDPWREVSWEEAIGRVASEFKRIQAEVGKDSIGVITSSRCTDEETYLVQRLARQVFRNNNTDTCARVCHSPTGYGLSKTFGTSAGTQNFDSIEHADVMVVIGANPTDGHPVFASRMKRRLREGAKLIVIDPRRIDLVRTPHIEASYHLPLRPGTNVAVLTSLAHVIVTEGLVNETFVRERCDTDAFAEWSAFVAEARNSPEEVAKTSGVPAESIRQAARLYAGARNGAIYYGLGVTEHSQGTTSVMALANLAMATGNIGRPGVGVNPLRGQNNVQGSCDMGSFPHELPGYRHVSIPAVRAIYEAEWGMTLDRRARGHGMRCGARSLPERDGELRSCVSARFDVPGEGRHVHQRRAPHQPGAQGDAAARRLCGLGGDAGDRQGDGLRLELHAPIADHGRDCAHDAGVRGGVVRAAGAGLAAMARERQGAAGYANHARRRLRARQGQLHDHRVCANRREGGPALPALADDRPHPVAVQRGRADAAHRERCLACRGHAGNPPAGRRGPWRARW